MREACGDVKALVVNSFYIGECGGSEIQKNFGSGSGIEIDRLYILREREKECLCKREINEGVRKADRETD